mmetsp:Transcript_17346/g.27100  ORF Transcript_17346/g.27100 Transcript_17346/m.27100 type:complete len:220 (+) Transcript_17346:258-917(+)
MWHCVGFIDELNRTQQQAAAIITTSEIHCAQRVENILLFINRDARIQLVEHMIEIGIIAIRMKRKYARNHGLPDIIRHTLGLHVHVFVLDALIIHFVRLSYYIAIIHSDQRIQQHALQDTTIAIIHCACIIKHAPRDIHDDKLQRTIQHITRKLSQIGAQRHIVRRIRFKLQLTENIIHRQQRLRNHTPRAQVGRIRATYFIQQHSIDDIKQEIEIRFR